MTHYSKQLLDEHSFEECHLVHIEHNKTCSNALQSVLLCVHFHKNAAFDKLIERVESIKYRGNLNMCVW